MKKKKSLVAIVAILLIVGIGVTLAYYSSSDNFTNIFKAGLYRIIDKEVFESPDNWIPGETIPKVVTSKNTGTVPAAVRVSYTEKWETQDGTDITNQITPNPAIINFANTNDWTLSNGYYYYKYVLNPGDETSSFMESVTLDPNLDSVTCTGSGNEKSCEAQNKASGAKYKLTITIDTVQYDQYENVWETDVVITEQTDAISYVTRQVEGEITPGDVVGIGETEDFFVISSDSEKTVLLAKNNLLVGNYNNEKNMPGAGLQSEIALAGYSDSLGYGCVGFSATNYWDDGSLKTSYAKDKDGNNASYSGNPYPFVYDKTIKAEPDFNGLSDDETNWFVTSGYSIAYYVERYKDLLIEMGAPSTINARLLSYEEAYNSRNVRASGANSIIFYREMSYWLGSAESDDWVYNVNAYGYIDSNSYKSVEYGVRPVIEIPTSELQ